MNRIFYIVKAVLLGLLTTQIIATLHVYLSNADLYRTVTTITEAGYLAIPNQRVAHTLKEFGPAFYGGIFFTLSLGAGLSIFSVACAWIWDRIVGRSRVLVVPIVLLWLGTLSAVNSQGFCPIVSCYFLAVPPVVFMTTLKWMPGQHEKEVWLNRLTYILPVAILTMIWAAHADRFSFLDIRDYLLLSNPIGRKINDFYYRYTLYPAEVFKPLGQKTLKTCRLPPFKNERLAPRMENALILQDYLPVPIDRPVSLEIVETRNALAFKYKAKTILKTTFEEFFAHPGKVLKHFSAETDKQALFRQATIFCLLLGFPLTLYVMVFALIRFVLTFFVRSTPSSVVASAVCFSIGLALLVPLRMGRISITDDSHLSEALNSDCWQRRVAALRAVAGQKLEIGHHQAYPAILASPHVPERYWLAKALGTSRHPQTYQDLLSFLDDPCPNVVSMAFHALGQRGNRHAKKEIMKRIEKSDHWYNQWYAYKALRHLGWKQSTSKIAS